MTMFISVLYTTNFVLNIVVPEISFISPSRLLYEQKHMHVRVDILRWIWIRVNAKAVTCISAYHHLKPVKIERSDNL